MVAFALKEAQRAIVTEALGGAGEVVFLPDLDDAGREAALRGAGAVLIWNTKELKPHELALIGGARLLQSMTAGVDFLEFSALPDGLPVASNGGAYAEPMAEHALGMALAAAKRLIVEHTALAPARSTSSCRTRCWRAVCSACSGSAASVWRPRN